MGKEQRLQKTRVHHAMQGTCIDIQRKSNNWSYPSPSIAKTKPQVYVHSFLKFIPVGQKNCFTKRLKEKTKIQKKSMYGIFKEFFHQCNWLAIC